MCSHYLGARQSRFAPHQRVFHSVVSDALNGGNFFNAVNALPLQVTALVDILPILAIIRKPTSIRWFIVRKRNGRKVLKVRAHASSLGRIRDHGRSRIHQIVPAQFQHNSRANARLEWSIEEPPASTNVAVDPEKLRQSTHKFPPDGS